MTNCNEYTCILDEMKFYDCIWLSINYNLCFDRSYFHLTCLFL